MTDMFRQLESGAWADPDYFECPCRGGWLLSDFDSFHRCPFHAEGDRHPEDDSEFTEEEMKASEGYRLRMARATFKNYERTARESVALSKGYSCGFEMRMANEAMWERKERNGY